MQLNDQFGQQNTKKDEQDISSCPLPIRIKHPSWSVRKSTYEQILYYLQNITSTNQQILISGNQYTVETLLPYFENLVQEKHASVLLKGLQCVQQILLLDKKAAGRHCVKTLIDKGIEYFPLLSQQRKAILQKFLDVLELSKIDGTFLKNKLNLPHEKSVMYVIEVIGVLNVTQLKGALMNVSKKHQKKCVRQLAAQIAQQLQPQTISQQQQQQPNRQVKNPKQTPPSVTNKQTLQHPSAKLTIEKLPHYEQLNSKKQQQYSTELSDKIPFIIEQYSLSQLPSFSHVLRLMIDDNNHIININAIKCLVAIFQNESRGGSYLKNSLIPLSFPLLFIFNKFKSHKTHPINALLLSLTEAILKSTPNRVNDLLLAMSQGLSSSGSKANVKFGCALTFFRLISLLYQNEDLYTCTINENLQNENIQFQQKLSLFTNIKLNKNQQKLVQKIISILEKDKKYESQMYLIRYAIGGLVNNELVENRSMKDLQGPNATSRKYDSSRSKTNLVAEDKSTKKAIKTINETGKKPDPQKTKPQQQASQRALLVNKTTLKQSKSSQKFTSINLQQTLSSISKSLSQQTTTKSLSLLLQRSTEQFYQCVRQRRYEMFYLCELLEGFIDQYEPTQKTIEMVSEYLINLLKVISMLKPILTGSKQKARQINLNNVSQLLAVALFKLAIGEQVLQVLQNLSQNYEFEVLFECLQQLFIYNKNMKIKKKNKKPLLQWLEMNTPAMFLNDDYYKLIESLNEKREDKNKKKLTARQSDLGDGFGRDEGEWNKLNGDKQSQKREYSPKVKQRVYEQRQTLIQSPKLKQTLQPKQPHSSSSTKQIVNHQHKLSQLQGLNLSKIQNTKPNQYQEYMQKSSFHQNIQQQLKQIKTYRTYEDQNYFQLNDNFNNQRQNEQVNYSRQYLRNVNVDRVKGGEKMEQHDQVWQQYRDDSDMKRDNEIQQQQQRNDQYSQVRFNNYQIKHQLSSDSSQHHQDYLKEQPYFDTKQPQEQYNKKFIEVEQRRLQRQKQRRQFMDRMKFQFQPINNNKHTQNESDQQDSYMGSKQSNYNKANSSNQIQSHEVEDNDGQMNLRDNSKEYYQNYKRHLNNPTDQQTLNYQYKSSYQQQQSNPITTSPPKNNNQPTQTQSPPSTTKQSPSHSNQCSFLSSTESGGFKYRLINHQKVSYMLKSTSNPYPHLRTLILIPFKSSNKKHQFLQQLIRFFTNQVEFKLPQPYTSLTLLTILMFAEIKQDKSLIQPLQSLYELVAKQSTTNDFIKTIISLFHTVIQQTLQQTRKFLITILLKSMIRMLPFIEDGVSLLRDIQQFYQIGQMVYFEMFDEQYTQIKTYIEDEAVDIVVEKALEQEGDNLKVIVEGWLTTVWKQKVLQTIDQFANQQHSHQEQQQHQYHHQSQNQPEIQYKSQTQTSNYQSYI